jgi:hypothetical protein
MMLFAAALVQAIVPAPAFAPPIAAPLRIVTERVESSAGEERRYRLERLVRFTPEEQGYRAEVVLLGNDSKAPDALANLVERGLSSLTGRTIVIHLDKGGRLIAIDDMSALWETVCRGIADAVAARRSLEQGEAAKLATRLTGPLRALPAERQRTLVGSLVTAAISGDPLEASGTITPVELPGTSPFGGAITLQGTRRSEDAGGDLMRSTTNAAAQVQLPFELGGPARSGSVALERVRVISRSTGMLESATDTTRTASGGGSEARTTLLVTRIRIQAAASTDWPS